LGYVWVRRQAVLLHGDCPLAGEPVEDAFCECWERACRQWGPCWGCYVCNPVDVDLWGVV
jgi:hypothetical protein